MNPTHILLVEDDDDIARLVQQVLERSGFHVERCTDLTCAQRHLPGKYALLVLDRLLPDGEGLHWLAQRREAGLTLPVLMLTALDDEAERVAGLEGGADDYLGKPFSLAELAARVKALLRRAPAPARRHIGALELDLDGQRALWKGRDLRLNRKELQLLAHFVRHVGQVCDKQTLLNDVWGTDHDGYEHTLNVTVNRLRSKLKRAGAPSKAIETRWGVGYRLNPKPLEDA